jgi:hypothetical protein
MDEEMDDAFWASLGQSSDDKEMEDAFWASIADDE